MKIYLAGPMKGIKDHNYPAFHREATVLRGMGHEVWCPAEYDVQTGGAGSMSDDSEIQEASGFNLKVAILANYRYIICTAECVALMVGWKNSRGSKAERAVAEQLELIVVEQRLDGSWP